jgi:D-threo-aldose 1-dehydrogenase
MLPDQRVPFGKTGLTVTRLGLGTAPLGGLFRAVSEEDAQATIERAYQLGLRLFDTAPLYGHGLAERRLGGALATKPRSDFTLSTKVGRLLRPDAPPEPGQNFKGAPPLNPVFDFSYDGVLRSLEESRSRLGLDRVDIALIHDPDQHFEEALHGAYRALDQLRREGTVKAVGAGMNQAEMPARFARAADVDCFLLAGRYTLLDQVGLRELLPLCQEKGIAIIAGGVYNSGILADPAPGATYNYAPAPPQLIARAQRIEAVCRRHNVPLKAAAIQFPLGHPAVACVVIGARSTAEIEENVAMFRHPVPPDLWAELAAENLLPPEAPTP